MRAANTFWPEGHLGFPGSRVRSEAEVPEDPIHISSGKLPSHFISGLSSCESPQGPPRTRSALTYFPSRDEEERVRVPLPRVIPSELLLWKCAEIAPTSKTAGPPLPAQSVIVREQRHIQEQSPIPTLLSAIPCLPRPPRGLDHRGRMGALLVGSAWFWGQGRKHGPGP